MHSTGHESIASWTQSSSASGDYKDKNISAKLLIGQGPVVKSIIETASREGADLVAMASHGRGAIQRTFYGSVAAGVLQRIDRPLLLIRSRS
jgi:nucleotide-binding universal stress UspA family protein